MEGKKYKVKVNGQFCTETFDSFTEATEWVKVFSDGIKEITIESVDVDIQEVPKDDNDLLLG
tara:strand:- start:2505 stop:2690 length:186 start_codon:yes stop_codon:yes gene_type:complete